MDRARLLGRVLGIALALVLVTSLPAGAAGRTSLSTSAPSSVDRGAPATASGTVLPRQKRTVALQQLRGKRWATVGRTATDRRGVYSLRIPTASAGRFVYRVQVASAKKRSAVTSRRLSVTVRAVSLGSASSYSFLAGEKYRWDPCTPIAYRVNTSDAPAGWSADVTGTLKRVQSRSGLQFSYQGTTSARPGSDNYPDDTAFVIGYEHFSRTGRADAGVAGFGGGYLSTVRTADGDEPVFTEGYVLINADVNDKLAAGFGYGNRVGYQGTRGQLMMHEVAHAVGLGHTARDRAQIMFTQMTDKPAEWGRGDAAGLAAVGSQGGCITPLLGPASRFLPAPRTQVSMQ